MLRYALFALAGWCVVAPVAGAQTSFTYDALGRLKVVAPSSDLQTCYTYDAADNRTKVTASVTCVPSSPTASTDFVFQEAFGGSWSGNLGVLYNDTDPNLPYDTLTVTAVSGCSCASVVSGGGDVYFSGGAGYYPLQYTIKDSSNATSSAWMNRPGNPGGHLVLVTQR